MSRARPIAGLWFDQKLNHRKATAEQLDTLAAVENIQVDDLLDEGLSQGEVIKRLRLVLNGDVIPPEVLERKRLARDEASRQPECRMCTEYGWECEGRITRHHFVPRWMMLELPNYQAYAARSRCTIPVCLGRHRDLHYRSDLDTPKSIVALLTDEERAFAHKMLAEFKAYKPHVYDLIAGGDEASYEYQLVRDFTRGEFARAREPLTTGVLKAQAGA
jgi:hypothetical protein